MNTVKTDQTIIIDNDTLSTQVVKTIKPYRTLLKKMTLTCPEQLSAIAKLDLNETDYNP